jgi:hypothetical protein
MIEEKEELKTKKDRLFVCDGKLMMRGKKDGVGWWWRVWGWDPKPLRVALSCLVATV